MTYFTFLGIFLVIPILALLVLLKYKGELHTVGQYMTTHPKGIVAVIVLHILLAVSWTTPWDNYLVATSVWWYDPDLVNGMTIWYVPIEEYTFFVLQPIMTGLWLVFLFPRVYQASGEYANLQIRKGATAIVGVLWLIFMGLLFSDLKQFTYLSLELVWAIPPIMLQLAFGADILRKQWRLVLFTILSATIFLSSADLVAIGLGTWTIDPMQSTGILLVGILPIEEFIFFLLTNILIVFGVTLALVDDSKVRLKSLSARFS
jgi:lycopene beta-cyclase